MTPAANKAEELRGLPGTLRNRLKIAFPEASTLRHPPPGPAGDVPASDDAIRAVVWGRKRGSLRCQRTGVIFTAFNSVDG